MTWRIEIVDANGNVTHNIHRFETKKEANEYGMAMLNSLTNLTAITNPIFIVIRSRDPITAFWRQGLIPIRTYD